MKIDELNTNHILAEEGMVFKRKSDGLMFGRELWLGYTYYLGGELLQEPLLELPEHYEEVPDPYYYQGLERFEIDQLVHDGVIRFDEELQKYVEVPIDPETDIQTAEVVE